MISIFYSKEKEALKALVTIYKSKCGRTIIGFKDIDFTDLTSIQGKCLILKTNSILVGPGRYTYNQKNFIRLLARSRLVDLEIVIPICAYYQSEYEELLSKRIFRLTNTTVTQVESRHKGIWSFYLKNFSTNKQLVLEIPKKEKSGQVYRSIEQTRLHSR